MSLKIVKIGGSVITYKDRPYTINSNALISIAEQVSRYVREYREPLLIIHGGGSFGHAAVSECIEKDGVLTSNCVAKVFQAMLSLNKVFCEYFVRFSIPIAPLQTHSIFYEVKHGDSSEIVCSLDVIKLSINANLYPVLFGDVILVYNEEGNHRKYWFRVLSGDEIAWLLTKALNAKELIFVTNVGGLYTSDPYTDRNAKLIRSISRKQLDSVSFSKPKGYDVTGGMELKVRLGIKLGIKGVVVKITDYKECNLYNSLVGIDFRGTIIWY